MRNWNPEGDLSLANKEVILHQEFHEQWAKLEVDGYQLPQRTRCQGCPGESQISSKGGLFSHAFNIASVFGHEVERQVGERIRSGGDEEHAE